MDYVTLLVGFAAVFFIGRTLWRARPGISPRDAHTAVKAGTAVLIDVREPAEWTGGVAKPAALLALSDLRGPRASWRAFLEQHRDKQLVLYCFSGSRSGRAAALLRREGYQAVNLGGLARWTDAGLPVGRAGSSASGRRTK